MKRKSKILAVLLTMMFVTAMAAVSVSAKALDHTTQALSGQSTSSDPRIDKVGSMDSAIGQNSALMIVITAALAMIFFYRQQKEKKRRNEELAEQKRKEDERKNAETRKIMLEALEAAKREEEKKKEAAADSSRTVGEPAKPEGVSSEDTEKEES